MKIISHSGAKGLAGANNIKSIALADTFKVDYIEFDVQFTGDNQGVLSHNSKINGRQIKSLLSSQIPPGYDFLAPAMEAITKATPIIELKQSGTRQLLHRQNIKRSYAVASFHINNLIPANNEQAVSETFVLQKYHPIGLLNKCQANNFTGLGVNKNWLLVVPFIYSKAQKKGKKMFIYTLNSVWLAKIVSKLMPELYICTDRPDKLLR